MISFKEALYSCISIFCSLILMIIETRERGIQMKNLIPVILVVCFTLFTGYLMITGEMGTDEKDDKATEQKKDAKSSKEKKEKKEGKQDLAEIIYSKKDEKTKMDAYNQAVEKKILPRSNNYQEAVYAYEESVQIKESISE